jgi:phage terminase Nu1 subunit (DNA packaging protein)
MSLRAYAKRRGVSAEAVSKAITVGRLDKSVTRIGGAPKIADPELADREWDANTQQRVDQPAPAPRDPPEYIAHRTAREGAAARKELALAEIAELELAERKGEFIRIEDARRDVMEKFTVVRTHLLGVVPLFAARFPELAGDEMITVLDELIRGALEELADGDPDVEASELEEGAAP